MARRPAQRPGAERKWQDETQTMRIEILYFPDCPNYLPAVEHLQKALQKEHMYADVKRVQVLDAATATAIRFSALRVFASTAWMLSLQPVHAKVCASAAAHIPARMVPKAHRA